MQIRLGEGNDRTRPRPPRGRCARSSRRRAAPPAGRARSQCRFVPPLVHFVPESLTYSVPLSLKRQCDRTPPAGWAPPPLARRGRQRVACPLAPSLRRALPAPPRPVHPRSRRHHPRSHRPGHPPRPCPCPCPCRRPRPYPCPCPCPCPCHCPCSASRRWPRRRPRGT
jgi:hypothetical protein